MDVGLLEIKTENNEADMVFEFQCHVREHYGNHLQIFTDGSKDQETEATGAAVMVQRLKVESSKRTSDFLHVFTIELYAILMAIKWTEQLVNQKVLICSDSVSAITSIGVGTAKSHQDLVYEILMAIRSVSVRGVGISLMWVPAHTGISGNEKADKLAKAAVKKENVEVTLHLSKAEGKCLVWRGIMAQWQQLWERD